MSLIDWLLGRHRRTTLEDEINQLKRKLYKEELCMGALSDRYFEDGGICCPNCGLPGYRKLGMAQDRREKWLKILLAKQKARATVKPRKGGDPQ